MTSLILAAAFFHRRRSGAQKGTEAIWDKFTEKAKGKEKLQVYCKDCLMQTKTTAPDTQTSMTPLTTVSTLADCSPRDKPAEFHAGVQTLKG